LVFLTRLFIELVIKQFIDVDINAAIRTTGSFRGVHLLAGNVGWNQTSLP